MRLSTLSARPLIFLGKNPNSESSEDLKSVEQALLAGRPYIRYVDFARNVDDLANGRLQDFLRDAVRVLAAAFALAGSADRALYWFRSHPIQDFDYKTPEVLVSEGRATAVIQYIESLHAGATG